MKKIMANKNKKSKQKNKLILPKFEGNNQHERSLLIKKKFDDFNLTKSFITNCESKFFFMNIQIKT